MGLRLAHDSDGGGGRKEPSSNLVVSDLVFGMFLMGEKKGRDIYGVCLEKINAVWRRGPAPPRHPPFPEAAAAFVS